jgi:hypothetical protein
MAGGADVCQPQLVAWAWLPGSAATGAVASKAFGIKCVKSASNGQWNCLMDNPVSLTDGSAIFMAGSGVPSDSNSGIVLAVGDLAVGNIQVNIRHNDDGLADNVQPASFMIWKLPRLT